MTLQHLRSSTASKRPTPAGMSDGQLALNTNSTSPGLFFKDSTGALVKVGPVHVGTTAPNASPASGGSSGNAVGEQWLDTSGTNPVFKVWDGSAWQSDSGEFVNASGDTMTGALGIIAGAAATPGLYISGDSNTGLYSPGADQLALTTGGTGRVFVNASGQVGVGTTPSKLLHLSSATGTATPTPTELRIATTSSASDWSTTSPWGRIAFYSADVSTAGPKDHIVIDTVASSSAGGISDLSIKLAESVGGTLVERLKVNYEGTVSVTSVAARSPATWTIGTSEVARIDANGYFLVGTSTARNIAGSNAAIQVEGSTSSAGASLTRNSADTIGPILSFGKTRGTTAGSTTTTVSGDNIGTIRFGAADGINLTKYGASISANVDGTIGQTAGTFTIGQTYQILTTGTTDFTLIGAADSNPGTQFTATGAGTGTGTALNTAGDMPGRLVFSTTADNAGSPTERMRIGSTGVVAIGNSVTTGGANGCSLRFGNALTGGTTAVSIVGVPDIKSDVTSNAQIYYSSPSVENAVFTLADLRHFNANQGTIGASATVTNQFGFIAASSLTGATNNFGFYSAIPSGTGRWSFYAVGTADSSFASNNFIFANGGTEKARFDSSGRLLVGTSASITAVGSASQVQVNASNGYQASLFSADTNGSNFFFLKSRNATTGSHTVVQSNDVLGQFQFAGSDGTSFISGASISAAVDGTPGTTDMPGRLVFSTTLDGASTPTERMRITNAGRIGLGQTSPATTVDINGAQSANVTAIAALDIDCSTGNFFTKNINGNSQFTVSNVPANRAYSFTLELTITSGTPTWFSGLEWPGGTAPTLSTGKTHLLMFVTSNGGTRWRGSSLANYTT